MYTIKKILLKESSHHKGLNTVLFYSLIILLSVMGQSFFAQDKELPSIFNNNDHYNYYRIDTIDCNDEIFQLPNPYRDTSFWVYSISKLWNEDTCGHKGYRINIAQFLEWKIRKEYLFLYKKDIIYHFGEPYSISEYRDNGLLSADDSTEIYEPELDVDFLILKYPIVKDRDCKNIKEFVEFKIDRQNNQVHSISFLSDFFETETDIGR